MTTEAKKQEDAGATLPDTNSAQTPLGISRQRLERFKKAFEAKWLKKWLADESLTPHKDTRLDKNGRGD